MNIDFKIVDLLLVSPALVLFITSLIVLSLKAFRKSKNELKTLIPVLYGLIGVVAGLGACLSQYGVNQTAFTGALVFDGMGSWAVFMILVATAVTLVIAKENPATVTHQFPELVFLLLNAAVGMMLISWANDLMILFIGIEIMSLCLYLSITLSLEERKSKEAAFKYFVLGSFASAVFLYGVAFIYGTAGSTYLLEISDVAAELIGTNRLFLFGVVLVWVGLAFKAAIFPFHAWAPDVYQGSPTPITGFMAAGVKVGTFIAFLRFVSTQFLNGERTEDLVVAAQWLAVLTMIAGNAAALMQTSLKRMLAYSSIAHSGYILLGVLAAGMGEKGIMGASGVVFYIMSYAVMTLGTFGLLSIFEKNETSEVHLDDLKGLHDRHPGLAAGFSALLMSLAGLPPTVGFFAKFYVFSAVIKQGFIWAAVWGMLSSVIGIYYYLRPIVYMYMTEGGMAQVQPYKYVSQIIVGFCAIVTLVAGIFSNPFYDWIRQSVSHLF